MSPAEFWDSTPREVVLVIEADAERRGQALDHFLANAWFSAALPRYKRFPEFEAFVGRRKGGAVPDRVQSPAEQRAVILSMVAMGYMGGRFEKTDEPPPLEKWEKLRAEEAAWLARQEGRGH